MFTRQVINVPASAGDYANRTRAGERVQSPVWLRLRRVRAIGIWREGPEMGDMVYLVVSLMA